MVEDAEEDDEVAGGGVERAFLDVVDLEGDVVEACGGGAGGPLTAETATVQVAFDYLRVGMAYLGLPLWDGSAIKAGNAVFEDRGNGNVMWTGEVPGAPAPAVTDMSAFPNACGND